MPQHVAPPKTPKVAQTPRHGRTSRPGPSHPLRVRRPALQRRGAALRCRSTRHPQRPQKSPRPLVTGEPHVLGESHLLRVRRPALRCVSSQLNFRRTAPLPVRQADLPWVVLNVVSCCRLLIAIPHVSIPIILLPERPGSVEILVCLGCSKSLPTRNQFRHRGGRGFE